MYRFEKVLARHGVDILGQILACAGHFQERLSLIHDRFGNSDLLTAMKRECSS